MTTTSSSTPEGDLSKLMAGEMLKHAREQRGFTVDQVSAHLRIKPVYIDALERGDFDLLPGQVYINGFIKSYATFLGLNGDQILQKMKRQTTKAQVRPEYNFPAVSDDEKFPGRQTVIVSICALLFLVLVWNVMNGGAARDNVPRVPKELKEQLTPPPKPAPVQQTAAAEPVVEVPKPHPIVLKAIGDSWIEIKDDQGIAIFSRVLKVGEEFWVPNDGKIYSMTSGNAGGLKVILDGKEAAPLGRVAEVKRNISLDPAKLAPKPSVE